MNGQTASPERRVFYGWWVVAAAFAITFIGFGSAYTFSAFLASLEHDFGASRGQVALVFSLAGFLYFALGIVSGPLADRFGSGRTCARICSAIPWSGGARARRAHSMRLSPPSRWWPNWAETARTCALRARMRSPGFPCWSPSSMTARGTGRSTG